jgi:hypothetical protein
MGSAVKKSVLVFAAFIALAVMPAAAMASSDAIIKDCTDDGTLNGHYSPAALKNTLGHIPSDVNQYEALLKQLDKQSKNGGSGGGGAANSALISKAQRKAITAKVAHATQISPDAAIPAPAGTTIEHAGQTLASSATPSVPSALIIAVIGMFLLFAVELGGRITKRRRSNS